MATVKKTTIRRYNGSDWDSIYLTTSADIVGTSATITVDDETTGWAKNDTISAGTSIESLLIKIINRIQYDDNTVIAGIDSDVTDLETWQGNVNTALNLTQVIAGTGTIPLSAIPETALERLYTVPSLSALSNPATKTAATNGDTIQVQAAYTLPAGKKYYSDSACTAEAGTAGEAMDVTKKTADYGEIDVSGSTAYVKMSDCTSSDPDHDGEMYYVVDDTKLGTVNYMDGIHAYTAGRASSVEWSNVLNKPTTISGYGITDAYTKTEIDTTVGERGTGGAAGTGIMGDIQAVEERASALETAIGETPDPTAVPAVAGSGILKDIYDLKKGTAIENINLNNTTLTGTMSRTNLPADVGGKVWPATGTYADLAAAETALSAASNVNNGDVVKLADGSLYMVTNNASLATDAGYTLIVNAGITQIAWSQITNTPTTLSGYGITDAVSSDTIITDGIDSSTDAGDATKSGKVVSIGSDGKVKADVTHMGGHAASYYEWLEYASTEAAETAGVVDGQIILVPVV